MTSTTWLWAGVAFLLVFVLSCVPVVGAMLLAPLAAVVLGALAGRSAVRVPGAGLGAAFNAGAIVGVGALLASMGALAVFGFGVSLDPGVQEAIRATEPHPEARVPYAWVAPLGASFGAFIGLLVGVVGLVVASVGGLAVGWGYIRCQSPHGM